MIKERNLPSYCLANERWIPQPGKGSLYTRPLLMRSGAALGLAPVPEYTFLIYISPVGNYSVLKAKSVAKAKAFSDVLYLDSTHNIYLEEVSSCNVFVVKGNVISTHAIKRTILPGITRNSIIDVARSQGFKENFFKPASYIIEALCAKSYEDTTHNLKDVEAHILRKRNELRQFEAEYRKMFLLK